MMALGSYPQPGTPDEVAQLCGQSFPYPYVPVTRGVLGWGYLDVWDARTRDTTSIDGIVGCCAHLWDVGGAGIVYPKQELAAPSISLIRPFGMYGVSTPSSLWPVSLGIWRLEDRRSQVVLAAAEKQRYWPTLQLPDGRLEVHVEQWEKDSYQTIDAPPPEREAYRYLHLNVDGTFEEESEQDLPWWAGGRLEARLSQNQLPQPKGRLASWQVGPDGETVVFAWRWLEGEQFRQGVYLWRGEGEPVRLAMGYDPQWQPVQSRP